LILMVNLKRACAAIWNASGTLDGGARAGQDGRADVVVTATAYAFDRDRDHVHAYGFGNVTANDEDFPVLQDHAASRPRAR
jgi:hypothetical protein